MDKENNFGRLLLLSIIAFGLCWGMYYLPDRLCGIPVKRVDLLADIRAKKEKSPMDSLRMRLRQPDREPVESVAVRSGFENERQRSGDIDRARFAVQDSVCRQNADSLGTRIEDYSVGHVALKRFFDALRRSAERPVRVAFLGDSFIEGDIVVGDFRSGMQRRFGGGGVGFVPVMSVASRFRPTVEQRASGWKTRSMLKDHRPRYTLSGMTFEPVSEAPSISVRTTGMYPESDTVSSLELIYETNLRTRMRLVCNGTVDTVAECLPPTSSIALYERKGSFTEASFTFADTAGFRVLGVALDCDTGVIVDNYSLRGNSGLILSRLDSTRCRELNAIRPYDLIVLQYGLNVVSDDVMQYDWYAVRMEEAVRHIRVCFPEADVLILGVSDRSRQVDGIFETMPAVLALLHAQRQVARHTGAAFWNLFGAMGGENSMVRYVERNWAGKDYTHLSFRGGREIASALLNALLMEKEFYDKAEKMAD